MKWPRWLSDWFREEPAVLLSPREFLSEAQRQAPPVRTGGSDLGGRVYDRLDSRLSLEARNLFAKGEVVVGEVGILTPNALAKFVPPRGYAIRVFTGLGHLFHTVGRILMTAASVQSRSGIQPRTRSPAEAADLIARLCDDLKSGEPIAAPDDHGLTAEKLEIATALANGAEDFVVAHEFGHMTEWLRRGGDPGEISPEEEYAADQHALGTVLGVGANGRVQDRPKQRDAYAGAEFALRIFGSLEHLDYEFERTHPLPGGRLKRMRETARVVLGSRFRFIEVSTIAFSWDQQLEEMERKIAGAARAARFVVGATPDRMLSTLSVLVEAMATGYLSPDETADRINRELVGLSPEVMQVIAREAVAMYEVEAMRTAVPGNLRFRFALVKAFKALKPRLPELFPPR